jgi:hypothetical protein
MISKEMSLLYFVLAVFCQFKARVPEFYAVYIQCILHSCRGPGAACQILEPEFRNITRRLKRYLVRGQAAQQGFSLFSIRVVGKIYLVHFHKTTIQKIALS